MHTKNLTRMTFMLLLLSGFGFPACMPGEGPIARDMEKEQPNADKRVTDAFGDPLPAGATARLGTVRFRHGKGVSFVAFAADGKKLVFGGQGDLDNAVRLVETSTGKEIRTFQLKPGERPWGTALSPDGKTLAVAAFNFKKPEGGFVLWDTATGKQLAFLDSAKQPSDVVVFSPDSKVLITQDSQRIGNTNNFDTRMKAWDPRTGKLLHEFKDLNGRVSWPAFSPDGKRMAVAVSPHNDPLELTKGFFYDTATWQVAEPMEARPLLKVRNASRHYGREFLAYSPDGKLLVGGDWFNYLDFMKAETGELIERVPLQLVGQSEATAIASISFSHDGKKLAVVSESGVVTIWENDATRKVLYNLNGPHSLAVFSPAEPLLATGGGWSERFGYIPGRDYPLIRFWNPSTGKEILKNDAPTATVQLTHWLGSDKLLALSPEENCYRLWDTRTSKETAKVPLSEKFKWVAWSAVSGDGKLLAVSQFNGNGNDETIQIFDLAAGKVIRRFESKYVRLPIGFTADGRFLLAGIDPNLINIWDTADGKLARSLDLKLDWPWGYAMAAAVSGDGKKLALQVSEVLVKPDPNEIDPGGVLRPKGYYRSVIDVATGKQVWHSKRDDSELTDGYPRDVAYAFAFSPDGKILAERSGQKINLRDSATGDLRRELKCEKEWYGTRETIALAFTPDSKKVIAADLRNNISVWDVATGKELQKFTGHRGRIFSVSVSPDGRQFATSSEDSTVLIWQLAGE